MGWKTDLDAIVGARHGGRVAGILEQLQRLDSRHPNIAEIQYQVAWTLDSLGRSDEAAVCYEKAIALGLAPNDLSGALIGLGSTLRQTGRLERAVEVLRNARRQFPENREIDAFLALALHAAGRHDEAIVTALTVLMETSEDPGITACQRTLRHQLPPFSPASPGPADEMR